jgi:hypothetical protein
VRLRLYMLALALVVYIMIKGLGQDLGYIRNLNGLGDLEYPIDKQGDCKAGMH